MFPHILLDRAKPGLLAVDKTGRRFVNEANSYHDFVDAMLRSNRLAASVPAFLVCDRSFIADYGLGLIHPGSRNLDRFIRCGYLHEGDTIESLAAKTGVDADALARTVERYNRYAETGIDEEFGRGTSALNRFNGDPDNKPNPCLRRIGPGPYFAMAVWPTDLAGSAGLRTDFERARAGCRRRAAEGPLRRRHRRRLDLPRHLSRPRHHDRPGHRVRLARGHGRGRPPGRRPEEARRLNPDLDANMLEPAQP